MSAPNGDGTWLRWIVGILLSIILLMAGAWAKGVSDQLHTLSTEVQAVSTRLTRVETKIDALP